MAARQGGQAVVELAPTAAIFGDARHPYTQALMSAVPYPDPDVKMNFRLGGEVACHLYHKP